MLFWFVFDNFKLNQTRVPGFPPSVLTIFTNFHFGQSETWTAVQLRTGYKTRTRYKMPTTDYIGKNWRLHSRILSRSLSRCSGEFGSYHSIRHSFSPLHWYQPLSINTEKFSWSATSHTRLHFG